MKKEILSAVLAGSMVLTMTPAAFAVEPEQAPLTAVEVPSGAQQPDEQAPVPEESHALQEDTAPETEAARYELTATNNIKGNVVANQKYENGVSATLKNTASVAGVTDAVLKFAFTEKPEDSNPQVLAKDTQGKEWNLAETGQWGPESGFSITGNYDVTTAFSVQFDKAGTYTAEFSLVSVSNSSDVLATGSMTLEVMPVIADEAGLTAALASAKPGDTVTVTDEIANLSSTVTVPSGVTLNVGSYLIKAGTVAVEPNAALAVASDAAINGKTAQEIVGPDTLANSSGKIEVTFAGETAYAGDSNSAAYETAITIPAGTTAEIKGSCWNNTGKDDNTYRLPKSDGMIVNGTLTISHDTTIAGHMVIGSASSEDGTAPLAATAGTVIVKSGKTLNIGKGYNADGEIIVEAGAVLKAGEDELIGTNSIDLTSGTAAVAFGTYNADSKTYDTAVTLKGDAEAKGSGVWSKDALTVESGTLKISSVFNVKGPMTVSKNAQVVVVENGALNLCYPSDVSHFQGTLQADGVVTVQKGGQLHVNEYGATGTINVDAGAKVLVTDATHGNEDQDEEMIGDGSLNITKGTATVAFTQAGTSVSIPADCEAEIAGPFMDADAYRLPKNDSMSVAGKLTVKKDSSSNAFSGMEVAGKLDVTEQGIVAVESGKLELVKTVSGQNQGSLSIDQNASVEVKTGAALDVQNGTVTASGKVYTETGATFTASDEQKENVTVVEDVKALTFTFHPNGGTFADGTTADKTITTLAHPYTKAPTGLIKPGYTFSGWSGLSADGAYTADTTFTAQWQSNGSGDSGSNSGGSSSSSYAVSVSSASNGSVSVSPKNASKGQTVTITVKPDAGYELDELVVTDKNGGEISVSDESDTKYTFTMPSSKVTVKATFTPVSEQPEPGSIAFTDVASSAYYYDAVKWAVENGITSGTSATTFSPDASCTRAQMVTFLWRANGSPKAAGANPFTDVNADAYYYDAVLWAVENGITSGTSATAFSPDMTVTRGQTVTFLHRANGSPAVSGSNPFTDVAADAYYAAAVQWAVAEDVTAGTAAATFSPDMACTRGQIVTFLYRDMV